MSETKIVILNAPKGVGKDVAAAHIRRNTVKTSHMEFKEPLIKLAKVIYNVTDAEWDSMYTRVNKELPQQKLNGKSPRDALIHISETVIKPNFGEDFFGNWAVGNVIKYENIGFRRFVFSDSGFPLEVQPIINHFGAENVTIVRVFREGHDYSGDSRGYLSPDMFEENVQFIDVYNNSDLKSYLSEMLSTFKDVVGVCD